MGGYPAVTAESSCLKIGLDKSGADQHDVNGGIADFRSKRCKEPVQGMLAGTVTGSPQQWCNSGQAFNDDNDSLALDQAVDGGFCTV